MTAPLPPPIFDQALIRRQRQRAAAGFAAHAALHRAVGAELNERLQDVARDFPQALLLGTGLETVVIRGLEAATRYCSPPLEGGVRGGGVPPEPSLGLPMAPPPNLPLKGGRDNFSLSYETLPFAPASFDLIVSSFFLHRVNDVPGLLAQFNRLLKPGGLFLAAFPGGETLGHLRQCLMAAELAVTGGVSPRVHPTISVSDASALLQRAGFQLPVTDSERYVLTYPDFRALLRELRGMGEGNALFGRLKQPTRRAVFLKAAELYQAHAENGALPAVFDIVYLHGWKA